MIEKGLKTWMFWLPFAGATLLLSLLDFGWRGLVFSVLHWAALTLLAVAAMQMAGVGAKMKTAAVVLFAGVILSVVSYGLHAVGYTGNEDPKLLVDFIIVLALPLIEGLGLYLGLCGIAALASGKDHLQERVKGHGLMIPILASISGWAVLFADVAVPDMKALIMGMICISVLMVWALTLRSAMDVKYIARKTIELESGKSGK